MASAPTLTLSAPIKPSPFLPTLLWRSYLAKLRTDPLITKSVTAALLSLVSDLVSARATSSRPQASSLLQQFSIGLALRGPVVHFWHTFLDAVVFKKFNQAKPWVVVAKTALDQLVFAPFFNALYFYVIGWFKDENINSINYRIRTRLAAVMKSNWAIWVPANVIAYAFIPIELRVLWGNIINIFWTAFLIRKVSASSRESTGESATSS